MADIDWLAAADKLISSCVSSILSIKDRAKNPDHNNHHEFQPDMPADERARIAYYDACDRLAVARAMREVGQLGDWPAIVRDAEEEAERARAAARDAYDTRMAAGARKAGPC